MEALTESFSQVSREIHSFMNVRKAHVRLESLKKKKRSKVLKKEKQNLSDMSQFFKPWENFFFKMFSLLTKLRAMGCEQSCLYFISACHIQ